MMRATLHFVLALFTIAALAQEPVRDGAQKKAEQDQHPPSEQDSRQDPEDDGEPSPRFTMPAVCVTPISNQTVYLVNTALARQRLIENLKRSRRLTAVEFDARGNPVRQRREALAKGCDYLLVSSLVEGRVGVLRPPVRTPTPTGQPGPRTPGVQAGVPDTFVDFTLTVLREARSEVKGRLAASHDQGESQLAFSAMDLLANRILREVEPRRIE